MTREYHFNPRILIEVDSRIYQSPTRLRLNIFSTAGVSLAPRGSNCKRQSLFHHGELSVAGIELKAIPWHLAVSIANLDFDMQLLPEGPHLHREILSFTVLFHIITWLVRLAYAYLQSSSNKSACQ